MAHARLERLCEELRILGVGCAVLVPGPNLFYLTGLRLEASERLTLAFIPAEGQPALLLPLLEEPEAKRELQIQAQIYSYRDEEGPKRALSRLISELGLQGKTLGVEFRRMRLIELRSLERHIPGCRISNIEDTLAKLRMIKDDSEIQSLRRTLELTELALEKAIAAIEVGMSEAEIARLLKIESLKAGAEGQAFAPIVASGPNADSPHARTGGRTLKQGDLITIDCGASYGGYMGDLTRTVALGEIDPELERVHRIVEEANAAGREACRPGIPAQEVDRAARAVIEGAGYGRYFVHRTGHGLGLEVHEPPYIMEGNEQLLEAGMVFTVEPGIYLPKRGGARIEDVVLITPEGAETLTSLPREPIRI